MIINHNLSSINANRMSNIITDRVGKSISKLSSGQRITRAGDDASGLAVSERMRSQISGLKMASRNATDGISFIQTTEGYLSETQDVIRRIKDLAIQSSNGIYSDRDRAQIDVEVKQLIQEVDRIASHAQFNGMNMLTGGFARGTAENQPTASMWFHIGAYADQRVQVFIGTMSGQALKLTAENISISTAEKANNSIALLDDALDVVSKQRADLGAYQNRMEKLVEGVEVAIENTQAAESRIRDANMAEEMAKYTRDQILSQVTLSMLAQANARTQSVIRLIG